MRKKFWLPNILNLELVLQFSQTQKDKYHVISLICGILKKKKNANELIYKTEVESWMQKINYGYQEIRGWRDKLGDWD